ncbi:MAG: metallophosphoesterase family protein, partial [Thermoguttaceae bacterium]
RKLYTLLKKVFADYAGIPVHHCIGNHDCFGWEHKKGVTPKTPGYGKKMVCEYLGLERTYYRFDHKGWRFFVLDDIQYDPEKVYVAGIDGPQLAWLKEELKAKPPSMPAAAVCHIPILSVTSLRGKNTHHIPETFMCRNPQALAGLFAKYNLRLALSGHTHQVDRVDYRGVTYLCNGAVCGAWWKGPHSGFQEGFGVIDLGADQTIANFYYDYGWTPPKTQPNSPSKTPPKKPQKTTDSSARWNKVFV